MGDHKREKTPQDRWRWEIRKREQFRPEHRTIGVLTVSGDPAGTLVEDSHGNRYFVAQNGYGKPAGLRKLTEEQVKEIEALIAQRKEVAARATEVVLRPDDVPLLERSKVALQRMWRKIRAGR